jgi:hypothetical protein
MNTLANPARSVHACTRHLAHAAALLLLVWVFAGCHRTPAEQQVHEAIDAAAAAARTNDTHGVLDVVSNDFTGNEGELDRRGLRQLLAVRAMRGDKTGLLVGPVSFEHRGDRIVAKFNLVLTGGKPGDLLPEQSAIYAMTTAWRREGGEWKCYSASWSQ